jgi:hypothetical protein
MGAGLDRTIADTPNGSKAMSDLATIHNERGSHDQRRRQKWP